jgi:adenine-specific DNA methylase
MSAVTHPTEHAANLGPFPPTRYQGSKRRLADAILEHLRHVTYTTVLDAFGGTGAVAYAFKQAGKQVTYNDVLRFNHQIGLALIENNTARLDTDEIEDVVRPQSGTSYGDFIQRTFQGIYFTDEENRWLDMAVVNIHRLPCPYKRALAWFAVFQSAMAKRPYNLFHRKNLYMRFAEVKRSFGNKVSWDRSFTEHFTAFAEMANQAILESEVPCRALCQDALTLEPGYDLVYIDTPYINGSGVGVNYRDFYHFLEGLILYHDWPGLVDYSSKHRRLTPLADPWSDPRRCHEQFHRLFRRFRESVLVVSYRSDGTPSIDELAVMLRDIRGQVHVVQGTSYQYALSTNRKSRETLLIA